MGRKSNGEETVGFAYKFPANLVTRFGSLCEENGVSQREGMRRALLFCVMEGRIPGIEAYELTPDATEPPAQTLSEQAVEKPLKPTQRYAATLKRPNPTRAPVKAQS